VRDGRVLPAVDANVLAKPKRRLQFLVWSCNWPSRFHAVFLPYTAHLPASQVTEEETMSIFGKIVSAIFGSAKAEPVATGAAPAAATVGAGASAAPAAPAAPKPMTRAEVETMIANIASSTGRQNYNWKQSIVDLMKLLDIDSSLGARKELAQELGYTGKLDGSAEMNVWLHKQVMAKLMESGGVVPASLK
jgi:hypothetical protein